MIGRLRSAAQSVLKRFDSLAQFAAQLSDLLAPDDQHYERRKHNNFRDAHVLIIRRGVGHVIHPYFIL